jgi:signal transduction histidine kinase
MQIRRQLERATRWTHASTLTIDVLIAVVVAGAAGTWSLYVLLVARPPLALVLGSAAAAGHAAIALRRLTPRRSFAAVSAACAVQALAGGTFVLLPSVAVFPLSLYSCCAWGRRPAPAASLAVGVCGSVLATARFSFDGQLTKAGLPPLFLFGFVLAVVLVAWSLGLFRRVQLAYVAALEERAAHAEAEREERARLAVLEERARIAREMHDVIAHSLAVIVSQAQGGLYAARADPGRAAEVLGTITTAGRQALADMRGLLGVLRTETSAGWDVSWVPQPTLADLSALLDRVRGSGLSVTYSEVGTAGRLAPAAGLAVYRIVQEALTNTMKHAGPGARAEVQLSWADDGLSVTVRDDGRTATPSTGAGHGLVGMRERLASLGGWVSAGPGAEGGFLIRARLPRWPEPVE